MRNSFVDALRGFAILSIVLMHNCEHFAYKIYPSVEPLFIKNLGSSIMDMIFFLFLGKSYLIFSILFGFTFAIMYNKAKEKGKDFRPRYLLRLLGLMLFGLINHALFTGDILFFYSLLGISLVFLCRVRISILLWGSLLILAFPPQEIFFLITNLFSAKANAIVPLAKPLWEVLPAPTDYIVRGSYLSSLWNNLYIGIQGNFAWTWEVGRFFQAPAMFVLGFVLASRNMFSGTESNIRLYTKIVFSSLILAVVFFVIKDSFTSLGEALTPLDRNYQSLLLIWYNFSAMSFMVTLLFLVYHSGLFSMLFSKLAIYGRMSLTNYVSQSLIGLLLYTPLGLNLAPYLGMTASFLLGLLIFLLQLQFCQWWFIRHKKGPLEYVWHKITYISLNRTINQIK